MKNTVSFHSTIYLIFATFLIHLMACESRKKTTDSISENESQQETLASAKSGLPNMSGSFKEFVNKKSDFDLNIYPSRANGLYDPKEMIDLSVEIYNPKQLAFYNYKNNLGPDTADFKFKDVFIGTDQQSWTDHLTLFVMDGTNEEKALFSTNLAGGTQKLNIGQGEIGFCSLLIQPGYFSKSGSLKFNLIYQDPVADKKLFAETSITLQDNLADIRQRTCSEVEYLLATNKTQQALELAIQTVKKWPESYNARVLLGSVYEKNNQPDEALRAYRYSLGLFKSEEPGQLTEAPIGLYQKIKDLEAKLKK